MPFAHLYCHLGLIRKLSKGVNQHGDILINRFSCNPTSLSIMDIFYMILSIHVSMIFMAVEKYALAYGVLLEISGAIHIEYITTTASLAHLAKNPPGDSITS